MNILKYFPYLWALLILIAPFFSSADVGKPAKVKEDQFCYNGIVQGGGFSGTGKGCGDTQNDAKQAACEATAGATSSPDTNGVVYSNLNCGRGPYNSYVVSYDSETTYSPDDIRLSSGSITVGMTSLPKERTYTCPPDDFPEYSENRTIDGIELCFLPDVPCGSGYLDKKSIGHIAANAAGCIPVTCPAKGEAKISFISGSLYSNAGGTSCDGFCAMTASGGQNNDGFKGGLTVATVSTGDVCGGKLDDKWFSEKTDEECEKSTADSGASFVNCSGNSQGDDGTGGEDKPFSRLIDMLPHRLIELPVDHQAPRETCYGSDTAACESRNTAKTVAHEARQAEELAQTLHNKNIAAQTDTTNHIVNAIDGSRNAGVGNTSALVDAINGLGKSLGTGSGDGDGNCVGDDCSSGGGGKGSFDMDAANAELVIAKAELKSYFETVKNEASSLVPALNGGGGSFNTCFDVISFQGKTINKCTTEYADEMSVISKTLLFVFTVISGFIVLGGVTKT